MGLTLSLIAIGGFCVVAAILEALIGDEPSSEHKPRQKKRKSDRLRE
jgi:hypothetical protein